MQNGIRTVVLLLAGATALLGQTVSQFTVYTDMSGATFKVDGMSYTSQTVFFWPIGSKHTLELLATSLSPDQSVQYSCSTWTDNGALLIPGGSLIQTVTADPAVTSFKGTCGFSGYRVDLYFFGSTVPPQLATPNVCAAPGNGPADQIRVGLVQVIGSLTNGCYWQSTYFYAAGPTTINAFPYPGYVFLGWAQTTGPGLSYLKSYNVTRPMQMIAEFAPARRVEFRTNPAGLQVVVDRNYVTTPAVSPCPVSQLIPIGPVGANLSYSGQYPQLCLGDYDFAFGSQHVLAAPTAQKDGAGDTWIFDAWQDGSGQNAVYTTPSVGGTDLYTAHFLPGITVSFNTKPAGLKLQIDGRTNWTGYNFVWASGSHHQVSAPLQQTDAAGRQYVFRGWSNGGDATQDVVATPGLTGIQVATYDLLGRATITSSTAGLTIQAGDTVCKTPCTLDRPAGTVIALSAPSSVALGDGYRADFTGWNDSAEPTRNYTFTTDNVTLVANYQLAYRLSLTSDPSGAATFQSDPASTDGYYPFNTQVMVSVQAKSGYKFRRWSGDVSGGLDGAYVMMNGARYAQALFDRVPYISPTGVRNAAGETPDAVVAPGSLIAITGAGLVDAFVAGPSSPLVQTLAGVYVTMADRILPLVSVAPDQIIAQLPSDLDPGDYSLKVYFPAQPASTAQFTVARNAPGLYASTAKDGTVFALASHQDGSSITPSSPSKKSETISLFGTGFGPYDTPVLDGFAIPAKPVVSLADKLTLMLDAVSVEPTWTGAAPGMIGIAVTRFVLPDGTAGGSNVKVKALVNGRESNIVPLPVE